MIKNKCGDPWKGKAKKKKKKEDKHEKVIHSKSRLQFLESSDVVLAMGWKWTEHML